MRRSGASSGGRTELPQFKIGPVLEAYGGEPVIENMGKYPYRCPFHGDSTASATVNPDEGWFNCHANDCPKGNAVQIIMKKEGIDYARAVERAEEISGASDASILGSSRRGSRLSGGTRHRSGAREVKRPWRRT